MYVSGELWGEIHNFAMHLDCSSLPFCPWMGIIERFRMKFVFRGRFELKLDQKSRLALPVSFRSPMSENDRSFVVTNSKYKNLACLDVYTYAQWLVLEEKMSKLPNWNTQVQAFQRFYMSAGQKVDMNSQGRVLIPKSLKDFAELGAEVVLVGMGEKFEIWDKKHWNKIHSELSMSFEDVLAEVSNFESGGE